MQKIILSLVSFLFLVGCDQLHTKQQIKDSELLAYSNPPKLGNFQNVDSLKNVLVDDSEAAFTPWRQFPDEWRSHTPITQFGNHSEVGYQNDINYVILGSDEKYVNELDIILNVKNPEESDQAHQYLSSLAEQSFSKLKMDYPEGLKSSILEGNVFYFEDSLSYITLQNYERTEKNHNTFPGKDPDDKIKYDSWTLKIISK